MWCIAAQSRALTANQVAFAKQPPWPTLGQFSCEDMQHTSLSRYATTALAPSNAGAVHFLRLPGRTTGLLIVHAVREWAL